MKYMRTFIIIFVVKNIWKINNRIDYSEPIKEKQVVNNTLRLEMLFLQIWKYILILKNVTLYLLPIEHLIMKILIFGQPAHKPPKQLCQQIFFVLLIKSEAGNIDKILNFTHIIREIWP